VKRYHMLHHFRTPDARFGVSSPLWDIVFGTKPASE
jgi:sterol desaturase/sphingolipid hydroxylase (fatty acid hydroxylase superfamily)